MAVALYAFPAVNSVSRPSSLVPECAADIPAGLAESS
jgi:hypothetical protein